VFRQLVADRHRGRHVIAIRIAIGRGPSPRPRMGRAPGPRPTRATPSRIGHSRSVIGPSHRHRIHRCSILRRKKKSTSRNSYILT
jgi:hypothetical protein